MATYILINEIAANIEEKKFWWFSLWLVYVSCVAPLLFTLLFFIFILCFIFYLLAPWV